MQTWVIYIVLYGLLKGMREPIKKKALESIGVLDSLFLYTFIGFLFTIPISHNVFAIAPKYIAFILLKSGVIFAAWIAAFASVKKLPVSLYGLVDMSRVIFSTILGVFVLGEALTVQGIFGLLLVVTGLYLANAKKDGSDEPFRLKYIWLTLLSCALNAVSGTLDKFLMATGEITSSQLQFWFMLTLSAMYFIYIHATGGKIDYKAGFTNPRIYILSALLIFGDKLLFIANADPQSKVTVMTLIKQCSVIVTILAGKFLYREKHILYRCVCAAIVIFGIFLAVC